MKKFLAMLLTVIMVLSMAACTPAEPGGTTAGKPADTKPTDIDGTTAAANTTEPEKDWSSMDLTGIAKEDKINIGLMSNSGVLDYNDNEFTKYMEELTGLEIEFTFFSADTNEAQQQLALMIANKEMLPDVIFGVVDETLASEYGQSGVLCDLTEYVNKAHYVGAVIEGMTDFEREYFWHRMYDGATGEIYFFPSPNISDGVDSNEWMGGISKNMAKKVGMDAAQIDTVDEVYEYLTKVVKEDGNDNGKADEIGFLWQHSGGYRSNAELWIINAYVFCSDTYIYNATDGEVWVPYNTDEYRQAMITLNKWYSEGLISPLTFSIKDKKEEKAMVDVGEGNYTIAIWGGHPTLLAASDSHIGDEYMFLQTLKAETDKGGYSNLLDRYKLNKTVVFPANAAEPERTEVAFRFCDLIAIDEVYMRMRYGVKGVNWDYIDGKADGKKDRRGNWAGKIVIKDEKGEQTKATWQTTPLTISSTGSIANAVYGETEFVMEAWDRKNISYGALWDKETHAQPEEIIYSLIYNTEENEVVNEYSKLYKEFVMEARAQMVTGVIDPNDDAQWAKYLSELKANGEEALIEVAQSAYTRMNG